MTTSTATPPAQPPSTDVDVVRAGFEAFAGGDLAALATCSTPTRPGTTATTTASAASTAAPTAIVAFLAESALLTAGTLRAVPQAFMADGAGPRGRAGPAPRQPPGRAHVDDPQVLLFDRATATGCARRPVRRRPGGRGRVLGLTRFPERRGARS